MATTLTDLTTFLDKAGLNYEVHEEHSIIGIGFSCEPDETTYRDGDGDATVRLIVRLAEEGEFVGIFAPRAWSLENSSHIPAVCMAAARIQCRMKLVRFDLDEEGYLHPNIEIPLESAPMCAEQLRRAITGILLVIRRFDAVICHARDTGEVDFEREAPEPPEPTADIARILDLADDAGGIDAIERLLGGGGPLHTDA
jgi:hypothetical protein